MKFRKDQITPLILFLAASLLGLLASSYLIETADYSRIASAEGTFNPYIFIGAVILVTLVFLGFYWLRWNKLVNLWFITSLFITIWVFFAAFLPLGAAIALSVSAILSRYYFRSLIVNNIIYLFSFAGAGYLFGLLVNPESALIIIALMAGYDLIAVRYSKHMLFLAQKGIETNTLSGFMYPKKQKGSGKQNIGALGGGDVIIPLIFTINAFKFAGWTPALFSLAGSFLSLALLLYFSKEDKAYPGLPFICSGTLLGFLIWFVLFSGLL